MEKLLLVLLIVHLILQPLLIICMFCDRTKSKIDKRKALYKAYRYRYRYESAVKRKRQYDLQTELISALADSLQVYLSDRLDEDASDEEALIRLKKDIDAICDRTSDMY